MQNNYIFKLKHEGFPCWHIVNVPKLKEPFLNKLKLGQDVDVSLLGEILVSGWGRDVPEELLEKYNPEHLN